MHTSCLVINDRITVFDEKEGLQLLADDEFKMKAVLDIVKTLGDTRNVVRARWWRAVHGFCANAVMISWIIRLCTGRTAVHAGGPPAALAFLYRKRILERIASSFLLS